MKKLLNKLFRFSNDPVPTDEAKREALNHPNGWVYVIDPGYDPQGEVPAHAIKGAWKVNADGIIVGDFIPNSKYATTKKD